MLDKLVKLYNILGMIETKGESTKMMADCMRYVEQLMAEQSKIPTGDKQQAED